MYGVCHSSDIRHGSLYLRIYSYLTTVILKHENWVNVISIGDSDHLKMYQVIMSFSLATPLNVRQAGFNGHSRFENSIKTYTIPVRKSQFKCGHIAKLFLKACVVFLSTVVVLDRCCVCVCTCFLGHRHILLKNIIHSLVNSGDQNTSPTHATHTTTTKYFCDFWLCKNR